MYVTSAHNQLPKFKSQVYFNNPAQAWEPAPQLGELEYDQFTPSASASGARSAGNAQKSLPFGGFRDAVSDFYARQTLKWRENREKQALNANAYDGYLDDVVYGANKSGAANTFNPFDENFDDGLPDVDDWDIVTAQDKKNKRKRWQ